MQEDLFENLEDLENIKKWIAFIDILQVHVQSIRKTFEIKTLGASTYLFHVERMLVKIRECFLTINYRQTEFIESLEADRAAIQCFATLQALQTFIQTMPPKQFCSDEFLCLLHRLELDLARLRCQMRTLDQENYRQVALLQLPQAEQNLLQSVFYGKEQTLQAKLQEISDSENRRFVENIVALYRKLKKCYVVTRMVAVNTTLNTMADNIESLISVFSQTDSDYNSEIIKLKITQSINNIFNSIESLRFSANHDSGCSRNLFENAKHASQQLRKFYVTHQNAINTIQ
jgi:hypothetical protein